MPCVSAHQDQGTDWEVLWNHGTSRTVPVCPSPPLFLITLVPCRLTGLPPKYFPVPIAIMDGVIGIFDFLAKIFPQLEVCIGAWG